ncbi:ATP-dependent helicase [Microbacterium excoecariae]|uniref:ATP-dependent helicase n=1 Tax=Microbacterium excoecariae TaxID=2715210 RepID=UPI00140BAA0C|nr:ATP-dependent DNA helicase [Microbacterium excoecariae]NHI17295.1 ATP-dependent helicase [Microbacterium excoecariae]
MDHVAWDRQQRSVIDLPVGASAAVVGAPGSGKTAVLVARVARLVGADPAAVGPDQVLVLTPTRASATRLRDRLGLAVRSATPGPLARSVGSFAFQIVRSACIAAGQPEPELLTGAEQDRILATLIEGDIEDARISWPAHLGVTVRRSREFRSELRAMLDQAVELDATRDELAQAAGGAWAPVAALFADYADALASLRTNARDAAELLAEAVRVLRGPDPLPWLSRLRAVLVDDAQELTRGGVALLAALRARGVAVVAAGDPDIASGAFRGVTPDLFAGLVRDLGDIRVLRNAHRQAPELAWHVRRLTQSIGAGGTVEHRVAPGPEPEEGGRVSVLLARSRADEADRIARRLRELHLIEGVPWDRIAVIAHDTRQIVQLDAELTARDVPTRAGGSPRPLGEEPAVRQILEVVQLGMAAPESRGDEALIDALRSPFGGFSGVALRRLRAALRHQELAQGGTRSARELLREGFARPAAFRAVDTAEGRSAERLAVTLHEVAAQTARGATIHDLLWLVWDRARGLDGRRVSEAWRAQATGSGPTASEMARGLDGLVALFAAAKRSIERNPHDRPARFVREVLESDVPEDTLLAPERCATVELLTPANALSTEFDTVVIAGLQDGVWPNLRPRGGMLGFWRLVDAVAALRAGTELPEAGDVRERRREALHDEMRLFVRAVSRARCRLIVTAVSDEDSSPSPLCAGLPDPTPARDGDEFPHTLRGLVARHRRTLTTSDDASQRADAAGQLAALARAGVPGADREEWYGVRTATTARGIRDPDTAAVPVSPSQIDAFDTCGLEWAVRALGGDTVTSPSAGLGTILHAALERVPDGGIEALTAVVEERWGELDFETPWIAAAERRRMHTYLASLDAYLQRTGAEGGRALAAEAEFRYGVGLESGDLVTGDEARASGHALVSGVIDRVEEYPAAAGEHAPARARGFEAMRARGGAAAGRVVVADLKSGKSEARVSDESVADDAQLAAYQLAVEAGLIPGAPPEALAGARLVVVSRTLKDSPYRVAHQHALAGEARSAFLRRVVETARGMSAASFRAAVGDHCQKERLEPVCRIHTIPAVSA